MATSTCICAYMYTDISIHVSGTPPFKTALICGMMLRTIGNIRRRFFWAGGGGLPKIKRNIYIYIYIYILYTYIHTYIHRYICIYLCTCVCVCCVYVGTCTCVCVCVSLSLSLCVCVFVSVAVSTSSLPIAAGIRFRSSAISTPFSVLHQ